MLSKFDHYLTPTTKRSWMLFFSALMGNLVFMYYLGYDQVEIGSRQFYIGIIVVFVYGIFGIALGRGMKVWYQKNN